MLKEEKKTFATPTEKNVHGDALCFVVMGPSLLQRLAVGGWRLVAVGGWRLAVGGGIALCKGPSDLQTLTPCQCEGDPQQPTTHPAPPVPRNAGCIVETFGVWASDGVAPPGAWAAAGPAPRDGCAGAPCRQALPPPARPSGGGIGGGVDIDTPEVKFSDRCGINCGKGVPLEHVRRSSGLWVGIPRSRQKAPDQQQLPLCTGVVGGDYAAMDADAVAAVEVYHSQWRGVWHVSFGVLFSSAAGGAYRPIAIRCPSL